WRRGRKRSRRTVRRPYHSARVPGNQSRPEAEGCGISWGLPRGRGNGTGPGADGGWRSDRRGIAATLLRGVHDAASGRGADRGQHGDELAMPRAGGYGTRRGENGIALRDVRLGRLAPVAGVDANLVFAARRIRMEAASDGAALTVGGHRKGVGAVGESG